MKKTPSQACLAIFELCAFCSSAALVHAAPPKYTVTDLGTLGGDTSNGYGINALGQVVGSSLIKGNTAKHAARWTGTTAQDLGSLDGTSSYGVGINAAGNVAGSYFPPGSGSTRAVRWTGTTGTDLGTNSFDGDAINTSGQVAGTADILNNGHSHAVRWSGATAVDLGTVGGSESSGLGINDSGQVAGWSTLPFPNTSTTRAVRWTGTTGVDLGTLGGNNSQGNAINVSGQVAGKADLNTNWDTPVHAVRWTGTTPTDLGTLGGTMSYGYGINASGDVTGMSRISPSLATEHAFLYTGGKMYDLETLLVSGSGVTDLVIDYSGNNINDKGQIAATGRINGLSQHALLLDPVPMVDIAVTGVTNNGAVLHFTAKTLTGLTVKIQSSPDKKIWTDLPDISGPNMTEDPANPGTYLMDTTFYPAGDSIYFRSVVTRVNLAAIYSPPLGPFKLTQAELSIEVQASSTSDPAHGTATRAGDDLTYTFHMNNKGTAKARKLKVVVKLPSYIENQTNLSKQFVLGDIPLDSHNNPTISSGGVFHAATSANIRDASIVWDAGDLDPGSSFSESFTIHISNKVRTQESIVVPNEYVVYGENFQPPYSATGYSSGSPNVSTEVRGPIAFTAMAKSSTVAPGGLITYKFKLSNLTRSAVKAAAVVTVPAFTRFATSYPTGANTSVPGITGVSPDKCKQVFVSGQAASQVVIDVGSLDAAGGSGDSVIFNLTFQAQWTDPAEVPTIGAFDYYAVFFNKDMVTNPYNPSVDITQYQYFQLLLSKAGTSTPGKPGPIDFVDSFKQTDRDIALSHNDSGDVYVPLEGSMAKQPEFYLVKIISNKASNIQNGVDTAKPGDKLTFQIIAANNGKSVADDVYIEDGLPGHTSFIKGSAHLLDTPITASTTASTLRTYPDADGHHVRFEGMNLQPNDGVLLEYSVLVDSGVAAGTLLLPAAVINPDTGLPDGGVGASSIGSSSTPHTAEGYYLNGAIKVTGAIQLAQPTITPLMPSPVVSTNVQATADKLKAVYDKDRSAHPLVNPNDVGTFIPGVERYNIHFENVGTTAVQGVQLVFPLPDHTAFYRASFYRVKTDDAFGVLIDTPDGSSIDHPLAPKNGVFSTKGDTTFTIGTVPKAGERGCKGDVMVEVIVMSDVVTKNSAQLGIGAAPVYIQDTPVTHKITAKVPILQVATPKPAAALLASNTAGSLATPTSVTGVPKVGIFEVVPKEVKSGDQFQIEILILNNGSTTLKNPFLFWTQPAGTEIVNFVLGGGKKQNPADGDPIHTYVFELASNNITVNYNQGKGSWSIEPGTSAAITVTLKATGATGSDINYLSDAHVSADFMGQVCTPLNVTRIVASPLIGLSGKITGAPLIHRRVNNSDVFLIKLDDLGANIVAQGAGNIVAQGGGNIVAQGGGNIVAQGGGNLIVSGASSLIPIGGTTGAAIVAQGGGNIVVPPGSTIVAQGAGNIVAQGGGNIVAQGGGNIEAQGGGNFVSLPGTSASFITKDGNSMGVGGSNFRPIP